MMYYGKYLKNGELISLLSFDKKPRFFDELIEITAEEYDEILAEIYANTPEEDFEEPTYDELWKSYTILTGGEVNE